ncbi:hypothetical protein LXL04_034023 [Taraxacum kok-saghyz]
MVKKIKWGTRAMRRRQFYSANGFVSGNRAIRNFFSKRRYPHNFALTTYCRLMTSHIHFLTFSIKPIPFSLTKIAKLQRSLQITNIHNIHKQIPIDYNSSLAATFGPSQPNPNLNLAAAGLTPGNEELMEKVEPQISVFITDDAECKRAAISWDTSVEPQFSVLITDDGVNGRTDC